MNRIDILKSAAGWYFLLLPVTLVLLTLGGSTLVAVLRFVLETLNGIGAS